MLWFVLMAAVLLLLLFPAGGWDFDDENCDFNLEDDRGFNFEDEDTE